MAHGAGLIFRRLIVRGSGRPLSGEGVALETEQVHQADFEEPGTSGAVGRMTAAATLSLHRDMLVDERPLLVDVALIANGISAGQGPCLAHGRRPVRVMAITALHQTFIDPVVIRLGKVGFGRDMTSITQLGLALDQQVLFLLRVMGRVAVEATDIAAGVRGFREPPLLMTLTVTAQAACAGFLTGVFLEHEYFGFVAAAGDVIGAGTMAAFAPLLSRTAFFV